MKVKVTMNRSKLGQLTSAQIQAVKMTAEQLLHEVVSEAVIPFDEGTLQNVSTYVETNKAPSGIVSIVHETPYAKRLYYHPEYNFDKTINANARGEWWEEWITGAKRTRAVTLYKTFYRKASGGVVK
jgi:hypothetical protein